MIFLRGHPGLAGFLRYTL